MESLPKCIHYFAYIKGKAYEYIQFKNTDMETVCHILKLTVEPNLIFQIDKNIETRIFSNETADPGDPKPDIKCNKCGTPILNMQDIVIISVYYKLTGFMGISQYLEQRGFVDIMED